MSITPKDIVRIIFATNEDRYQILVPNATHADAKKIVYEARERAIKENKELADKGIEPVFSLIFEFENERLELSEYPNYIHHYPSNENYAYDTVNISVYPRR